MADESNDPGPKDAVEAQAPVRKKRGRPLYKTGPVPEGARGPVVREIQRTLGVEVTGVLDIPTSSAVRKYQRNSNLPVTGRVDVATRARLGV